MMFECETYMMYQHWVGYSNSKFEEIPSGNQMCLRRSKENIQEV